MSDSTEAFGVGGAELAAGRELDVLIAERLMGWTGIRPITVIGARTTNEPGISGPSYTMPDGRTGREAIPVPHYSTKISDAWLVVERLAELDLWVEVCDMRHGCYRHKDDTPWRGWHVEVSDVDREDTKHGPIPLSHVYAEDGNDWTGEGDTAPLAICRAALKAIPTPTNSDPS